MKLHVKRLPFLRNIGISLIVTIVSFFLDTKIVKKAHDDKMTQSKEGCCRKIVITGKVANQVQEFMTTQCHFQNHGPVNAYRLGKVQEGQKNPRPIKVLFKHKDCVNNVFKDDPNIYCLKDRPKEVRDHEYELRKATRALREENPSKEFRPRDMKVQTKNETGEWVDMMRARGGMWVMPTRG